MDVLSALLAELADQAGWGPPEVRCPVRVWAMSGVERVSFNTGHTAIFKTAREPFTREADILRHVRGLGVPVPAVFASVVRDGRLGMLIEDLGPAVREATMVDGAAGAIAVHEAQPPDGLPVLDRAALIALPGQALASLGELRATGRWLDSIDLDGPLTRLADRAETLTAGADLAPFGLCHSEFHPTSLHVGRDGWRLLDWARAFIGPGLLDLASWQGTRDPIDPDSLHRLILAYVRAGGQGEASRPRGGLPVGLWALGWHRLWITVWYLDQALIWMPDPDRDELTSDVVRRHVLEATSCLGSPR